MNNDSNLKTRSDSDLFGEIENVLRHLESGQDGIVEAQQRLEDIIVLLHDRASDDGYLSYCMLVAMEFDVLRGLKGESRLDERATFGDLRRLLNAERHYFRVNTSLEKTTEANQEIGYFIKSAKESLAKVCWHVIDPKKYEDLGEGDYEYLWNIYNGISDGEVRKQKCQFIVYELKGLFSAVGGSLAGVLEIIREVELGSGE